ncbi:hypothetical protein COOONC_26017 [Cooperia oncophora]
MDRISNSKSDTTSAVVSPKASLSPKGTATNGNVPAVKKAAEGLAGLYESDDDDMSEKDGGLDALFLVRNKPEEIERYVIHIRKMLLEGEGETVIELGVPIDQGGKGYFRT